MCRILDGLEFQSAIPSLGIPSDVQLTIDHVSLGYGFVPRHHTLLIVCGVFVCREEGGLVTPLLSAPTVGLGGHSGPATAEQCLKALREHPGRFTLKNLHTRLASISGDGAMIQGGEGARHSSTRASEQIWESVYGSGVPCFDLWDPFHRCDKAYHRSISQSPPMLELYDITAILDNLFGIGEGKSLYRAVASFLNDKTMSLQRAGTRKIAHLTQLAGHLIQSYQSVSLALHARLAWKQTGHGTTSLTTLVSVCRRFSDLSFVAFLFVANDVCSHLHSHVQVVQSKVEPWICKNADNKLLQTLHESTLALDEIQKTLLVCTLCLQHMVGNDIARLLVALSSKKQWRLFPSLVKHLPHLATKIPAEFRGSQLQMALPETLVRARCCGAHCQCSSWYKIPAKHRSKKVFSVTLHEKRACVQPCSSLCGRKVKVPRWVAFPTSPAHGLDSDPQARPRHQQYDAEAKVTGVQNVFRHHIQPRVDEAPNSWLQWTSRCLVPITLYHVHERIDAALVSGKDFLQVLIKEYEQMFGEVGVSPMMREFVDAVSLCWDFETLVLQKPSQSHCEAFCVCARMLIPSLRHSAWPTDSTTYPIEQKTWSLTSLGRA